MLSKLWDMFQVIAPLCIAAPAAASDQAGKITTIGGDSFGGPFVFYMAGSRTAKPACATDDAWAIPSPTTDNAKGLLSIAITAYAAGKTLSVHGQGSCGADAPTRETVAYFFTQ
ncbi:hypothetical protein SAMN05444678_12062 [Sphingomonas sp. YR710]|uniref:hypothetical protein n=1 Tax=Sphingomonas sp. YR710 TaxID=1882773 RepID=UPI00088973A5|nr:hypothetical protein [Sphingomonas sp. YR710]SDD73466.1 hypothetical protein SAMN05444678_12062 [Sphingomonas sp. YR710]